MKSYGINWLFVICTCCVQADRRGRQWRVIVGAVQCWWGHHYAAAISRATLRPWGQKLFCLMVSLLYWIFLDFVAEFSFNGWNRSTIQYWWAQISCLFTFPNICKDVVVTACVFPAECFPAGRRLLQLLLQRPDGAPAEAERRADGFRQPIDRRKERSEEPHAPIGGRAPTLPAGWTGIRRQCEYMTGNTTDRYCMTVLSLSNLKNNEGRYSEII